MFVLFCLSQKGTYLPQTYIIHEEMVVTGKVHNMRQLGPFIYRLCNGKDTYRLNRRVTHRRKPQRSMKTLHLIDASMVGLIVVIQAEVQPGSPPPPPPPLPPLCVSLPPQASTSAMRRTATTSVTSRIPSWWRRLSAMKREYDGQRASHHPPTQRHVSCHYPSHCSILLWFWSRLSCTLAVTLVTPPPHFTVCLFYFWCVMQY